MAKELTKTADVNSYERAILQDYSEVTVWSIMEGPALMVINTLRFGAIEILDSMIIEMVRPILGFEKLVTFCLVERDEDWPFLWMQSIDDPAVAFIIANPSVFHSDYRIEINPKEIAEIEPTSPESIDIYVIANIAANSDNMSVNLQGPILINSVNKKAKQLVLVYSNYKLQQPIIERDMSTKLAPGISRKEPVGV